MSNEKKKKVGGVIVIIKVVNGIVTHEGRWKNCSANDLSLTITSLELIKKDLLEAYNNAMKK